MPLVSVILPTYNRAGSLLPAVESVLRQTYKRIELIVIDDGSTDGTSDALAPYVSRIKYIHQENGGVSSARNLGIAHCTGDLIAFIDSDDTWEPDKLTIQIENLSRHRSAIADSCDAEITDPTIGTASVFATRAGPGRHIPIGIVERPFSLALTDWFWTSSWVIRRSAVDDRFTVGVNYCEDVEFISKIAARGPFHLTNKVLVKCGWGQGAENLRSIRSQNRQLSDLQRLEVYRRLLNNPSIKGQDRRFLKRYSSGFMQRLALVANDADAAIRLSLEGLSVYPSPLNIMRTGILPIRMLAASMLRASNKMSR
jgi:glycosyltransferase involved in cell wall biosynthesis